MVAKVVSWRTRCRFESSARFGSITNHVLTYRGLGKTLQVRTLELVRAKLTPHLFRT